MQQKPGTGSVNQVKIKAEISIQQENRVIEAPRCAGLPARNLPASRSVLGYGLLERRMASGPVLVVSRAVVSGVGESVHD